MDVPIIEEKLLHDLARCFIYSVYQRGKMSRPPFRPACMSGFIEQVGRIPKQGDEAIVEYLIGHRFAEHSYYETPASRLKIHTLTCICRLKIIKLAGGKQ